ncbi:MAG: HEPN domain-containing protein [Deltaproteobacteria bacterium]|nr:HEPN domain-containing protein [Deltaproteobacteria bacterium]
MPPNQRSIIAAKQWLSRARGSYARACQSKPAEGFWEDLCFDAQQAAEKSIKAVMILLGLKFPYTHDIGKLFEQLTVAGVTISPDIESAAALTEYAVETRYPGWGEPVTEDEYKEALTLACAVLDWATKQITSTEPPLVGT